MSTPLSIKASELYERVIGLQDYHILEPYPFYYISIKAISKTIGIKTNVNWISESLASRYFVSDIENTDEEFVILKVPEEENLYIVKTSHKLTLINLATDYKFFFGSLDLEKFIRVAGSLSAENSSIPNQAFLTYIDNQLVNTILGEKKDCFLLHANVLVHKKFLILLVGKSGAGKTTTSLKLVKYGSILFSDDLLFVDTKHFIFFNGPKRPESSEKLGSQIKMFSSDFVDPRFLKSIIFFLDRSNDDKRRTIVRIKILDALPLFIEAAYHSSEILTQRLFEFSGQYISLADSFLIRYSNPINLEDDILNVLENAQ